MKKKKKSNSTQTKEANLAQRLHDLMVRETVEVTIKESNPESGGTTMELRQGDETRIITLADSNESLNRNSF